MICSGKLSWIFQKGIVYIDNSNITENHLGMKKLHLVIKGCIAFAKNLTKITGNWNESLEKLDFIEEPSFVQEIRMKQRI